MFSWMKRDELIQLTLGCGVKGTGSILPMTIHFSPGQKVTATWHHFFLISFHFSIEIMLSLFTTLHPRTFPVTHDSQTSQLGFIIFLIC